MDFAVTKNDSILSVSNTTNGLCAVRITDMSSGSGSTQYKNSGIIAGTPVNQQDVFVFTITASSHYMVEAWHYNNNTGKLIPTAVKYI